MSNFVIRFATLLLSLSTFRTDPGERLTDLCYCTSLPSTHLNCIQSFSALAGHVLFKYPPCWTGQTNISGRPHRHPAIFTRGTIFLIEVNVDF